MSIPHLFELTILLDYAGAPIGSVTLKYQANLYHNGEIKSADIVHADYKSNDISAYVCAAQPETWEEWTTACEEHYAETVMDPAPVEHDDCDCTDEWSINI